MSLMNCFNLSYLKQNLKKSKVTLIFMLLIVPILTFIMLLIRGGQNTITILDMSDVSILTTLFMYILPVVTSLLLFNFVFKKKSVDFMGSMPIDRKTIFFTNTLGGILVLASILFITTILMIVASMILPNLYIPLGMCWDYFILFLTSYILVFAACNIAVSLSGNIVTSIIVTMLILFFIPFHHYVFKNIQWNNLFRPEIYEMEYTNENLYCEENDIDCLKENDTSSIIYFQPILERPNYTMPFGVFANSSNYEPDTLMFKNDVIGKTVVLIFIYILIGCLLFEKKEMEVCETSFKKFWQHQFVKSLTLIPIFILASLFLYNSDALAWIFVLAIILIYNFVYDLLTKHSIEHILISLACFAFVFMIVAYSTTNFLNEETKGNSYHDSIKIEDIEKIQIETKYLDVIDSHKWITIDDKEIIQEMIAGYQNTSTSHNATIIVTIDGKRYQATVRIQDSLKSKILEGAKKKGTYKERDIQEILKDNEVITIGNDIQVLDQEGIRLLEKALQKSKPTTVAKQTPLSIHIYKYENHSLVSYTISNNMGDELQKYIMNSLNREVRKINPNQVQVLEFNKIEKNTYNTEYLVSGKKIEQVVELLWKKHTIDLNQPIYRVTFFCNEKTLYYYTNLTEEILSLLDRVESRRGETYAD